MVESMTMLEAAGASKLLMLFKEVDENTAQELRVFGENGSYVDIQRKGARIQSLVLKEKEILWSGTRIDGGIASTHACIPNFGPETNTKFGLPQHGPVRSDLWSLIEQSPDGKRLVLGISVNKNKGNYPDGLIAFREIGFDGSKFYISSLIYFGGHGSAPVNSGEHFYFKTPQGWDFAQIENGAIGKQSVRDMVKINGAIHLASENILTIPNHAVIALCQQGYSYGVGWVASKDGLFDNTYVCIEPVEGNVITPTSKEFNFFGTYPSLIPTGNFRQTLVSLELKS